MESDSYRFIRPQKLQQQFNPEFRPTPRIKSKSCTGFLVKFLLIALFLCVIPLFPSDPPKFISDTVFAQSWELIHLLVIGLALSYGLFCRRKTQQNVVPKSSVSRAHRSNVVLGSSIFDYEGENPSGNISKKVEENGSYDFSCHRMEPYVVVRNESGQKVVERPLGLPVRSLRCRVVDSGSEEECEGESESASESDVESVCSSSRSSSVEKGEKGESLVENGGCNGASSGWKLRTMRRDFVGESGGVESYGVETERFEANVGSHGYQDGFRLESVGPGFMVGDGGAKSCNGKGENLDGNVTGDPYQNGWRSQSMRAFFVAGDAENWEGNLGSNASNGWRSTSMRAGFMNEDGSEYSYNSKGGSLVGDMKSCSMRADYMVDKGAYASEFSKAHFLRSPTQGGASYGINAGFCSWLPASPNMMEGNSWIGHNPNMMFSGFPLQVQDSELMDLSTHLGNNTTTNTSNYFIPSTGSSSSMTFSPSCFASRPATMYNYDENWSTSPNLENTNSSVESSRLFMPAAVAHPFMPTAAAPPFMPAAAAPPFMPAADAPHFMPSAATLPISPTSPAPPFAPSSATPPFMPSAVAAPFVPAPVHDLTSSFTPPSKHFTPTKNSELKSESVKTKFSREGLTEQTSGNDGTSPTNAASVKKAEIFFTPSTPEIPSSKPALASNLAFKGKPSRRSRSNRRLTANQDQQSFRKNISAASSMEQDSSSAPLVLNPSPVPTPGSCATVRTNASSLKKNEDIFMPAAPNSDDASLSKGSILKNEDYVPPQGADLLSISAPSIGFASSVRVLRARNLNHGSLLKKDEVKSQRENTKTIDEKGKSCSPTFVDPLQTPTTDYVTTSNSSSLLKNDEQRALPMKWDEDCFLIPSPENNDTEDPVQFEPAPELAYSSESASSADASSTRLSCEEQGPRESGVQDPLRASIDNSEMEDLSREIVSHQSSTPLPPPQVQMLANDTPFSVESSSSALADGFSLDNHNIGSPRTPKSGKALSKPLHTRGFSCTAFFDRDLRKSLRNEAKEENRTSNEDQYAKRSGKCGCMNLDVRPNLSKAALKGKSVRTIRPRDITPETTNHSVSSKLEQQRDVTEASTMGISEERKENKPEVVVIKIGISEKRSNSNGRKPDKHRNAETSIVVGLSSKEGSTSKATVLCDVKEDEPDSEIDKKADEFIAKFKEQIRLQKVAATTADSSKRKHPQSNSLYQT